MSHSQQKTNQQVLEYMVTLTEKLSKTFKELSEMGSELLKALNHNDRSERYKIRNSHKEKEKEREKDDLNSNLIDEEDEEALGVGITGRKKLKTKNRIQQAEQDEQEVHAEDQNKVPNVQVQAGKGVKKVQQRQEKEKQPQPQGLQQKPQDSKKKPKSVSHKPKAPTSSFLLFFKQQQQSIAKSYPNYGVVELTKVAAKCWNELSVEEKDPYQKLFEVERKKYQEEMEKYRREFPEQVRRKEMEKKEKKKKKAKERRDREVKQPKEKTIPIVSNTDANPYQQGTPGGVKIQDVGVNNQDQKDQQIDDDNEPFVKNEEEMASDELGSLEGESEENSLGEDI